MPRLVNLNKIQSPTKIPKEPAPRIVLSFYRYVKINDPASFRQRLFKQWPDLAVLGRIYLAEEGINAQLSVPESQFVTFKNSLENWPEFKNMPLKIAIEHQDDSFLKLTIKVKKQIVADGLKSNDYDLTNVGQHLNAEEFNEALAQPESIAVDMRNHYESRIGRFTNAITPDVDTFREELPVVLELLKGRENKKILLYCTGGIRCEKASAYLRHHGFSDVNQLYGGIINYAHEVKQKGLESKFKGKNFVFDERLGERITSDILTNCDQCGEPCDDYTNCAWQPCNLLLIQCLDCREKFSACCSQDCQKNHLLPAHEQLALRQKQTPTNREIFKSRQRPTLNKTIS